ncbi:sugar transferase [Ornithinibacillus halophilus]|uniref:Sugar transferase involved in LPS biosynthesis (Colanic, teichoic acid) n=1 Tax=Ornithinibacillus halophilus TaxID=930117 RepID=A0A1M5GHP2_9BACI|nr:sugar transferase [Ornithinibacillus halophilus]SHG03233.1 Sugar transferase involved in LPS biosynthesis (colanic, teichoic acid) [Ornithinibacillus halophilus]
MSGNRKRSFQLFIKRLLDICAALFALTICSPIYLIVVLYIKINTNEKVLFKQERAGLNGKPFICLKFRTMTSEADSDGNLLPDEFRLKKWGKFLRSTSLDELPQFINVLKGDMSLIGPRALLVRYLPRYTQEQMRRHEMRPGMTSWTAVNGRNNVDWEKKFKMDVWYIDNWSLLLDFKIFFLTFYTVFKRDGISKTGHATRDEFFGSKDNRDKAN